MIRMTKVPTTPTPSTTKLLPSHSSRSKTTSHCTDPFDESVCESAEESPPYLDELKSPPSSFFNLLEILLNFQNPPRLLFPINPGKDSV